MSAKPHYLENDKVHYDHSLQDDNHHSKTKLTNEEVQMNKE